MADLLVPTFLVAVALALAHLEAHRLRVLDATHRRRILSGAGGVSVAYVFLTLLPEVVAARSAVRAHGLPLPDVAPFLFALAGFTLFYVLERVARHDRPQRTGEEPSSKKTGAGVYHLHLVSFGTYNAVIGYLLLHHPHKGVAGLVLYGMALGLHFLVNDHALREHHESRYHNHGRWILTAVIFVGWGFGVLVTLPSLWTKSLFALLAGSVLLNVMKDEIQAWQESQGAIFAAAVAGYAILVAGVRML